MTQHFPLKEMLQLSRCQLHRNLLYHGPCSVLINLQSISREFNLYPAALLYLFEEDAIGEMEKTWLEVVKNQVRIKKDFLLASSEGEQLLGEVPKWTNTLNITTHFPLPLPFWIGSNINTWYWFSRPRLLTDCDRCWTMIVG